MDNNGSDFVSIEAALVVPWHHCVSTQILLKHEHDLHRLGNAANAAHDGLAIEGNDDCNRCCHAFGAVSNMVRAAWRGGAP